MNDQILQDILRRLARIEATAVRYRTGEVTDVAPLDVALGGSDVSYEDVQSVGPLADGDQVGTLLWGNDMLVIGALGRPERVGVAPVSTTASVSGSVTVTHGLGTTPQNVQLTAVSNGVISPNVFDIGATTFQIQVMYVDGAARTATNDIHWRAIG